MKFAALIFFGSVLFLIGCSSTDDISATRERLLTGTSIGADATNVLKFVVDNLSPKQGVVAYYKYVDAVQVGRTFKLDVQPEAPSTTFPKPADWPEQEDFPPHEIYVCLKSYLNGNRLFATWTFDKNDKLLKIYVGRDKTP